MAGEKKLHIICHDVPFPPDFGGVVDLYYKIKELHAAGIGIMLHCFRKDRPEQVELNRYCEKVYYYNRSIGIKGVSPRLPYIVSSRMSNELIENIRKDDHPVLMEGIHASAVVDELGTDRKLFLRLHNVEHKYYRKLFQSEDNILRRIYYYLEYRKLKVYEKGFDENIPVIAVSKADADYYHERMGKRNVQVIPVFVPFTEVTGKEGIGTYCLYHGNLSVAENEKAAKWLLDEVFTHNKLPLIIAGRSPSLSLQNKIKAYPFASLVTDPDDTKMEELIANAQVNVLPSFNDTGIKLKLVHALFSGRHCVVNTAAIEGSGMDDACHIADSAVACASIISQLFRHPFANEEIMLRKKILLPLFNNASNAKKLIQLIY